MNNVSLWDKIDLIWNSVHNSSRQSNQNTTYSKVNQFCIASSLTFREFEITRVWNYKSEKVFQWVVIWILYWSKSWIVLSCNFVRFVISNSYNFKLTKSQTPCNTKLIYFRVSSVLVRLSTWIVYLFSNQINFILQTPIIQTHYFFINSLQVKIDS